MTKNTLFEKIRRLSFLSAPLCFLSLIFLDFSFRTLYRFLSPGAEFSYKPALFTLGWALLLTGLVSLLPRLLRRIAMMVLIFLYGALTLVHAAMFNIFGRLFTVADIGFAGDGAKFFSFSYLRFRKALLLCILLSVLMMAAAAFLAPERAPDRKKRVFHRALAGGACALDFVPFIGVLVSFLSQLPDQYSLWWGSTYTPNAEAEAYRDFTNPNSAMMLTGLYQYTFRNILVSYGIGQDYKSIPQQTAYYEGRQVSGENEMTGLFKGKNLIMVMMESVDTWLCTPDYMPNLCALREEGTDFVNHYTPLFLSAGTFNTEIITLTGLVPAVSGLESRAYSTNHFPLSLPNLFKDAGYRVNSFHAASPSIYSRGSIHQNLGFERYHSYEDMHMEDFMLDSQMLGGYEDMVSEEPFFSYLITYSGHGPYNQEQENIAAPHYEKAKKAVQKSGVTGSEENMEEYTRAVAHAMETDELIGGLTERLRQDGHINDTVLVFYADHYAKYMTDKDFLSGLKSVAEKGRAELYHTPFFLYAEGEEPQKVEKYVSSLDMAPTLINLFGLTADRRYYPGDDIFGDLGGWVPLPGYGWFDGETYLLEDYEGDIPPEEARLRAALRGRLEASWDALKSDYFSIMG